MFERNIINNIGINGILASLSDDLRKSDSVQHAIKVMEAVEYHNYYLFFKLYQTVPNMGRFFMQGIFEDMRMHALKRVCSGFFPSVNLQKIVNDLNFDTVDECKAFLQERKVVIIQKADTEVIDTRTSLKNVLAWEQNKIKERKYAK